MTTPVPDPGPPPAGRGSGRGGRGRPNAGPRYGEPGWRVDLADTGPPADEDGNGPWSPPAWSDETADGYQAHYDGNGIGPADSGPDRPVPDYPGEADRPGGKHARRARSDVAGPAGDWADPGQGGGQDRTRRPPAGAQGQPGYYDAGQYGGQGDYAGRGDDYAGRGRREPTGYPDAGYADPGYAHPDPGYAYPEDRRSRPSDPGPAYPGPAYPGPAYPGAGRYAEPRDGYGDYAEPRDYGGPPPAASRYDYDAGPEVRSSDEPATGQYRDDLVPGGGQYPGPAGYRDDAQPRGQYDEPPTAGRRRRPAEPGAPYDVRSQYGDYSQPEAWPSGAPSGHPPAGPGRADPAGPYRSGPPDRGHTDRFSPPPGYGSPEPSGQPGYPVYPDDELTGGGGWPDPYGPPAARPPYREPQLTKALPIGQDRTGSSSVLKSSSVMAVGTLGSRLTGFLRTIAQSWALGVVGIGAAYNLSNTLPNVVYNLALGGILTSVIVPLIVNARRRDDDRGEAYEQRMFTLATGALLAITVVATLAAVPIVHLYSGSTVYSTPGELHVAIIFALFFIPQIFFYGVSSLIGAILNARGSFAAPMWTPIINNFVVIAVLALYVVVAGKFRDPAAPATISSGQLQLLGLGTTLGIVAQTAALVPALRRVGFRWQPRIDFRRAEVAEIGRMGGWMFAYIAATQVAFLITTRIAGDNSSGVTDYNYAWLLFQLPYAVVGISVITALLPRMSAHASGGQLSLVRDDFSAGIRLASVIVVPCSLVLAVLGSALAEVFLAHGATTISDAHTIGVVFAVFCLGLLPYMIFQLQLRVFYSLHDSKTPALIGAATMTVNIVANLIALEILPNSDLVAGLGVGFGLANVLGSILAWRLLSRRLGGLDGTVIGSTLGRMYAATIPAALLAALVSVLVSGFGARTSAIITIVIGGGAALVVYVIFAMVLQVTELTSLGRTLRARLGR